MAVQPDSRGTCIRVNLTALAENAAALKKAVGAVHMMAIVKANAYGHGMVQVARVALANGADFLGVATPQEGQALREAGLTAPVLVLGNTGIDGARICAANGITQAVCDADGVRRMQRACEELQTTAQVHLKCDTGMSRIGVRSEEEVQQVLDALNECPAVKLTGAFMHFAAADGDEAFARKQFDTFMRLTAPLPAGIVRHAAASDASIRFPWARLDMVREGISLYGCPGVQSGIPLRYAMSFETRVEFIKTLPAGETVGYGRTWTAPRETRVATLGVGYGDGYLRSASGKAQVLIGGQLCPVIGRVCMDQIMVDVTDVPGVQEGDCAVLMGRQGEMEITPDQLAAWAGTISYEVMLSPHPRVPVLYYEEGK